MVNCPAIQDKSLRFRIPMTIPARSSAKMETLVRSFSWLSRAMPTDNKLFRAFVLNGSHVFDKYAFRFSFGCRRVGVKWSSTSFPEQLTRHMLFDGTYQADVLHWIKSLCRHGDTVFDVGAFHGLMSIVASRAVGTRGRVVAFEPNANSVGHLNRHLALNHCTNVTVEPVGVLETEQEIDFYPQAGDSSWNSSFVREFVDPRHAVAPTRVKCTTLDAYVANTGAIPNLIKIDTEGTEFLVLHGATELIRKHRPRLVMEFNPESANRAGTSIQALQEYLTSLRYRLEVIPAKQYGGYDFRHPVPFSEDVPTLEGFANVACIPAD
jgi:FkbM family methyltransferase